MDDLQKVEDLIKNNEGFSNLPYKDTMGLITIGYGRNLSHNGITKDEANYLFKNDLSTALNVFNRFFSTFNDYTANPSFNSARKAAIVDMIYNLGESRFLAFKNFRRSVISGKWEEASRHLERSLWFTQVKSRAKTIHNMILTGEFPKWLR